MNSQQELLDAINAISQKQDRSCDTPATVLRVEDDTVWVHIDGGADETPVRKTISCEQGETVQVRISNGSAFLVGNASAPPTDDKTANVAHFVAEQADVKATDANEKATKAVEEVGVLEVEVEGKVDVGTSNIQHLSSTMYQNANGVNIYNDTLAVGDSYAHIDGDSFDIKACTTADTIDDANDTVYASFGREVTVGTRFAGHAVGQYSQVFGQDCIASGNYSHAEGYYARATNNYAHSEGIGTQASGNGSHAEGYYTIAAGYSSHVEGDWSVASGMYSHAQNRGTIADSDYQTAIGKYNVKDEENKYALIIGNGASDGDRYNALCVDWDGNVITDFYVKDTLGTNKTPAILVSPLLAASETSYTFSDSGYSPAWLNFTEETVFDIYDTIFGFAPTNVTLSNGNLTITFPAQSSAHKIKLFVY